MSDWMIALWDRLLASQCADGAWPDRRDGQSRPEPTALACLAACQLAGPNDSVGRDPLQDARRATDAGLAYLLGAQQPDGSIPAVSGLPQTGWPTAPAVLAWQAAEGPLSNRWQVPTDRAVEFLLGRRGRPFESDSSVYGHDTELVGWPWITDTHTWLEPTAFAILALRATGRTSNDRFREGVRVLIDRAVRSGGWNYGNSRMFGADLRPFPETTGLALAALAGQPPHPAIEGALRYLEEVLPDIRSPVAVAWSLIGMDAWGYRPQRAGAFLERSADALLESEPAPAAEALLLIATACASPGPAPACVLNRLADPAPDRS